MRRGRGSKAEREEEGRGGGRKGGFHFLISAGDALGGSSRVS